MTEGLHSQLPFCAPGGHEDGEELGQMRRPTCLQDCPVSCGENIRQRNARRRFKSGGKLNRRPFARRPIFSGYFVGGDFKIGELRCPHPESNWRPLGHKSDVLTTTLPSNPLYIRDNRVDLKT